MVALGGVDLCLGIAVINKMALYITHERPNSLLGLAFLFSFSWATKMALALSMRSALLGLFVELMGHVDCGSVYNLTFLHDPHSHNFSHTDQRMAPDLQSLPTWVVNKSKLSSTKRPRFRPQYPIHVLIDPRPLLRHGDDRG